MNAVHILGRLTADPDLQKTASGVPVAKFTIAVDRFGKAAGTDFIRCVAWRGNGENISVYFQKGKPIAIDGHLRVESYEDKNGNKRSSVDVVVDQWHFVPADKATSQNVEVNSEEDFQEVGGLEDLPF